MGYEIGGINYDSFEQLLFDNLIGKEDSAKKILAVYAEMKKQGKAEAESWAQHVINRMQKKAKPEETKQVEENKPQIIIQAPVSEKPTIVKNIFFIPKGYLILWTALLFFILIAIRRNG